MHSAVQISQEIGFGSTRSQIGLIFSTCKRESLSRSWELFSKECSKGDREPDALPIASAETPEKPPAAKSKSKPVVCEAITGAPAGAAAAEGGKAEEQQPDGGDGKQSAAELPVKGLGARKSPAAAGAGGASKRQSSNDGGGSRKPKQPSPAQPKGAKHRKTRTEFDDLVDEAESCRQNCMQAAGTCRQLLASIESQAAWSWGRTQEVQGTAQRLLKELEEASAGLPSMAQSFMIGVTVPDLVSMHGEERVSGALSATIEKLRSATDNLSGHVTKITTMHAVMAG